MSPLIWLLACSNDAPVAPPPPPELVSAAPAELPALATAGDRWPLFGITAIPAGLSFDFPGELLDLAIDPHGTAALVISSSGGQTVWSAWTFGGDSSPLRADPALGEPSDIVFSPFDASLYATLKDAAGWRLARLRKVNDTLVEDAVLYRSSGALDDLVASRTRYNDAERLFFSREYAPGQRQMLSVTRDGARVYELSTPSGALSELTEAALREPAEEWTLPPHPTRSADAVPLSIDSATGTLLFQGEGGRTYTLPYDEGNWGEALPLKSPAEWAQFSPNGALLLTGQAGTVHVTDPQRGEIGQFTAALAGTPTLAPDGRSWIGLGARGLETAAVESGVVAVRYLDKVRVGDRARLAEQGFVPESTPEWNDQMFKFYEGAMYGDEDRPMLLSIDAMLEVLHAGFQAVFVQSERERSAPALAKLAAALAKGPDPQLAELGQAVSKTLAGDYDHPEGARMLAEASAQSPLFGRVVDYGDFKPRGPYAKDEQLKNYFRAFKLINSVRLSAAQREALGRDSALVGAWKDWVTVQTPFLQGSRQQGILGDVLPKASWAKEGCLPEDLAKDPFRVYPLNWGADSEVLERVTAHDRLPPECGVTLRGLPSGLDLLAAFGSAHAQALLAPEYARYPQLGPIEAGFATAWQGGVPEGGLSGAWLRVLQVLAADARVPEGVDPAAWRNRLAESSLGSWVNLRHTLVLVNEISAAEAGEGGPDVFEDISFEPVRDVVDPVPQAWAELAKALDAVAAEAKKSGDDVRVSDLITSAAVQSRRLGNMAERQMWGESLTEDEYQQIHWYVRTVEEPFRLLLTAASGRAGEDYVQADPMMKIVDVHDWQEPGQPLKVLHVALGQPRIETFLAGDRGVLVPATGAFYGYYEVVTEETRLNDEDWRARLPEAKRPAWVNPEP